MNLPETDFIAPHPSSPCGPDCRHAHALPETYGEWIWCEHPAAATRLRRAGSDCRHFQPGGGHAADHEAAATGFSHRQ